MLNGIKNKTIIPVKCTQGDLEEYIGLVSANSGLTNFFGQNQHTAEHLKSFNTYIRYKIESDDGLVAKLQNSGVNIMHTTFVPDLSYQEFESLDLRKLDLSHIIAIQTSFYNSDLQKTKLTDSFLLGAKFDKCKFEQTDFTGSHVEYVRGSSCEGKLNYLGEIPETTDIYGGVGVTNNDLQTTLMDRAKGLVVDISGSAQDKICKIALEGIELLKDGGKLSTAATGSALQYAEGALVGYFAGLGASALIGATICPVMQPYIFKVLASSCAGLGAVEGGRFNTASTKSLLFKILGKASEVATQETMIEEQNGNLQPQISYSEKMFLDYQKFRKIDLHTKEIIEDKTIDGGEFDIIKHLIEQEWEMVERIVIDLSDYVIVEAEHNDTSEVASNEGTGQVLVEDEFHDCTE